MPGKNKIVTIFFRYRYRIILCALAFFYWIWLPAALFRSPVSTVLLSENDELLAAHIAADGQWRFPQSDSVPLKFRQCILHFEDEYFQYHPGINPVSIVRSLRTNLSNEGARSGGSTITMQLARMMRQNQPRN